MNIYKELAHQASLNVLIAGSRSFGDYDFLCENVEKILQEMCRTPNLVGPDETIYDDAPWYKDGKFLIKNICGLAEGADQLGGRWAKENGYNVIEFPADWGKWGRSAGHIRNAEMVNFIKEYPHKVAIFFWDGESKGTNGCIELCKKHGIPHHVILFDKS